MVLGDPPQVQVSMTAQAIQPVEFQMFLNPILTQEPLKGRWAHLRQILELEMVADQLSDAVGLPIGEPQTVADLDRDSRANLAVVIETDSVLDLKCLRLTHIMEQNA